MEARSFRILSYVLSALFIFTLLFSSFTFAQDYELTYSDLEGDVKDIDGKTHEQGYEYLDITQISSSQNILGTQLILEMTVDGVITDSPDITYTFSLMDDDAIVYMIIYTDGDCTGMDMENFESDVLQASGSKTSTLEVRVPMSYIGEIPNFDFYGEATHYAEDEMYWDEVPDSGPDWDDDYWFYESPVMITEPKPGATISGLKMIQGLSCGTAEGIISVEIQLDSTSVQGWELASTSNNWTNWEYLWDSTKYTDEQHIINARAFDGTEYYIDSIIVYVDQSNAVSPRTINVPKLKTGYELNYKVEMSDLYTDMLSEDMEMSMNAEMIMRVNKKENIEINGTRHLCYAIDMSMNMEMQMSYMGEVMSSTAEGKGTQWLRVSDLASVKSVMETETTMSMLGMSMSSSQKSTTTQEPPMDGYNFPISIAESWTSCCTVIMETTYTEEGEQYSEEDSYESKMEYEALHVETVNTPCGSYETFVIWSKDTSGEYSEDMVDPFGSEVGYSLEYLSPELGLPVKAEYYTPDRQLTSSIELVSYKKIESGGDLKLNAFGWELPIYFLFIPLLLIVILVSVLVLRKRRKEAVTLESWDQFTVASKTPSQTSQYTTFPPQTYPAQSTTQVQWELPSQTTQHPRPIAVQSQGYPVQTNVVYPAQPSQRYSPPPPPPKTQPYYTSSQPSKPQVSPPPQVVQPRPYPPPPPPEILKQTQYQKQPQQPIQPSQPVVPMIQIKCPRCSGLFSVAVGTTSAQCPHCKVSGRLGWKKPIQ